MGSADDVTSQTLATIVATAPTEFRPSTPSSACHRGASAPTTDRGWTNPALEEASNLSDVRHLLDQLLSREEDGQGLAEYALILALIAIVAILSMIFLGETINDLMVLIGSTIDANANL